MAYIDGGGGCSIYNMLKRQKPVKNIAEGVEEKVWYITSMASVIQTTAKVWKKVQAGEGTTHTLRRRQ
jgi:hypothetical protein